MCSQKPGSQLPRERAVNTPDGTHYITSFFRLFHPSVVLQKLRNHWQITTFYYREYHYHLSHGIEICDLSTNLFMPHNIINAIHTASITLTVLSILYSWLHHSPAFPLLHIEDWFWDAIQIPITQGFLKFLCAFSIIKELASARLLCLIFLYNSIKSALDVGKIKSECYYSAYPSARLICLICLNIPLRQ